MSGFVGFDVAKTGDARIGFVGKLHVPLWYKKHNSNNWCSFLQCILMEIFITVEFIKENCTPKVIFLYIENFTDT